MAVNAHTLLVKTYDDFRDALPTSGLFEMTDCEVEIWCPELSDVAEVERMVSLIESMVHVKDMKIGSTIQDLLSEDYRVVITEVPNDIRKKYAR
jgi:hypothetical protein